MATLDEKIGAVRKVTRRCFLCGAHLALALEKTRRGHEDRGEDLAGLDLWTELRQELADVAGYGGLFMLRGLWTWRLWAAVFLVGLAWRTLGRGSVFGPVWPQDRARGVRQG